MITTVPETPEQRRIQKFLKEGPVEAIIYKILERGGPKSLKMAF